MSPMPLVTHTTGPTKAYSKNSPLGLIKFKQLVQLMRKGEIYAKAVDSVAKARTVGPSTVRAHCYENIRS